MSSPYEQSVAARSSELNYHNKILAELNNEIDIFNFNSQDSQLFVLAFATFNQSDNGYTDGSDYRIKSLTFAINNKYSVELDFTIGNGSMIISYKNRKNKYTNNNNSIDDGIDEYLDYLECNNLNQVCMNEFTGVLLVSKLYETETINFDSYIKGRYQISWPLNEIILGHLESQIHHNPYHN
jgi:hypothetical protein